MKIMFYDTETTGLPIWKEPSEHPNQPHLCQFTAVLIDDETMEELDHVDILIKPDGWTIPDEVIAIHGITTERALDVGVPEARASDEFLRLTKAADTVCAYGIPFDMRIMRIAMLRAGISKDACDLFGATLKTHCVMKQATPFAKVPPSDKMMATGRKTFKTPSLTEGVKALLGEDLEGAHDANVDVAATMRLYFHMNPPKGAVERDKPAAAE